MTGSGSAKTGSEAPCIQRSCFAQVVYGTDYPDECWGAQPGELWMRMSGAMFEVPPSGLNSCVGVGVCSCPMQPGCYSIWDQAAFEVGELYEMACVEL